MSEHDHDHDHEHNDHKPIEENDDTLEFVILETAIQTPERK